MNITPIKALIIDDEALSADMLEYLVKKNIPEIGILKKATSAVEGLEIIRSFEPHLLFLDIQMPFMNGFELLNRLQQYNFSVIFITAYDKYAIKAIRFSALDYLLKPVDADELKTAVQRYIRQQNEQLQYKELYDNLIRNLNEKEFRNYRLALHTHAGVRLATPSEIIYCEAENNYTRLFLSDGKVVTVSRTIKDYEETLNGHDFIRVHKSYLVNLLSVIAYNNQDDTLLLKNGIVVPVSRRRQHEVLEAFKSKRLI
jgi:two-component system LytT family response regulator